MKKDNVSKPTAPLGATKKWFKEAQFGMMAHWGLYTLLGGDYTGLPAPYSLNRSCLKT